MASALQTPASAWPAPLSRDWDQVEDAHEVSRIMERIAAAARFDAFAHADLYELAYPGYAGDRDFYSARGSHGDVLYLGIGTGRIFGPLATCNPRARGIDNSPPMVKLLRSRYPHIGKDQVILADVISGSVPEASVDTVLAPYSFLQLIDEGSLGLLLRNVYRWLRPGGVFVADTFSPYLIPFRRKGLEMNVRCLPGEMTVTIYIRYDHARCRMHEMALIEQGGRDAVLEMHLRYYFPHEIVAALRAAGFDAPTVAGGYRGEVFDPSENEVIVYEATRPPEELIKLEAPHGNGQALPSIRKPTL